MPVVNGIDAFREALADYSDEYVLIGGGACSILFSQAGEPFRATKDLDIVVLTNQQGGSGFARCFWDFVKQNGYQSWKRKEGSYAYYRFNLPKNSPEFIRLPSQIELFARHPDFELGNEHSVITPLPFDENISSLSAIILDEGYYEFIQSHVSQIDGVPLLSALYLIPLKMRAHIDLNRKHHAGLHVDNKDLTKHRNDVVNLTRLLAVNDRLPLEGQMRIDADDFIADLREFLPRQHNRKLHNQLNNAIEILSATYLG